MVIIRSHDGLFRFCFGNPEQMAELLRSNLPPAVGAAIDWRALRRLDGSFVDAALQERHADLLFETRIGGRPLLLFVLVEHKSADEPLTAFQLLRYVVRVYDGYCEANPRARRLPPVLPFVVHHGSAAWSSPRSCRALVDVDGVPEDVATFLRALQPDLGYVLDDLAAASEESLAARRLSAVADLCLRFLQFLRDAPAAQAGERIASWESLLERLLRDDRGQESLAALFSWFLAASPDHEPPLRTAMARIHDSNTRQTMKSALDQLLDQGRQAGHEAGRIQGHREGLLEGHREGRVEGRVEGHVEGRRDLLRQLLMTRFGALSPDADARLRIGSPAEIESWAGRILTAASLDDVFRAD